jgi:hypothetical protein
MQILNFCVLLHGTVAICLRSSEKARAASITPLCRNSSVTLHHVIFHNLRQM